MANNFRRFTDGIQVVPKTTSTASLGGEMDFDTTSNKLNLSNGTVNDHVVTETVAAILTTKTLTVGSNHITSTVNTAAQFNVSTGDLESSVTTAAELAFVHGVTSNIQTQLNNTQPAGNYISALTGDVTATGPGSVAATVVMVGGSTAANVHSAELLANAATSNNTVSTIVLRDSSGNFAASTITAAGVASTSSADLTLSTLNNHNIQLSPNGSGLIKSNGPFEFSSIFRLDRTDDSTTTGSTATLTAFSTPYVEVTNASLVSLSAIPAGAAGQFLILTNNTGNSFLVNNQDAGVTAANRIVTGTGNFISFSNTASLELIYDSNISRWRIVGGSGSGGSTSTFGTRGSPLSIVAANGFANSFNNMSSTASDQIIFVSGSGGPVVVTASPAIQAGTLVGQTIKIVGRNNTNTVEIDSQSGFVELNGNVILGLSDVISLFWDGTAWIESSRS